MCLCSCKTLNIVWSGNLHSNHNLLHTNDTRNTFPPECESEQAAVRALGYTAISWDNVSGKEQQPWSYIKSWSSLTSSEKAAAEVLGYSQKSWDNDSGFELPPASLYKYWEELTSCPDGKIHCSLSFVNLCSFPSDLLACYWTENVLVIRILIIYFVENSNCIHLLRLLFTPILGWSRFHCIVCRRP